MTPEQGKTCASCTFADGYHCIRDGRHTQFYEMKYTDSDFCGPERRFFKRRPKGQGEQS